MAGNIFINYRRDESGHVAGRLHDSLAPKFGRNKLFMDVDNIPVGRDFEEYLKSQVAACDAMLAVIGPNWLAAKDDTGKRRLDNPDDFIVIEIGTALTRNIPVVPVLVDGARMPKASELPDSLKLLARRQAIQVRHTNFSSDAETLVKRLREALGYDSPERRWRVRAAIGVAAIAVLLLVGWAGYRFVHPTRIYLEEAYRAVQQLVEEAKAEREAKAAAEAEEKRKTEEQQRLAALRAEEDRRAKAAAEAEAKRKAEQAEQQRLAAVRAEEDRQARAAAEAEEKRKAADEAERQRLATRKAEQERQARAEAEAEAKRKAEQAEQSASLEDKERKQKASIFFGSADSYYQAGDYDRAIGNYNLAIRLNPDYALAFNDRGNAYQRKGDYDRAIADFNEAIRLYPNYARAFCNRGLAKLKINDGSGSADIAQAKQLDASVCR